MADGNKDLVARLTDLTTAQKVPHRSENCLQRIDKDQDRNNHRPANEDRNTIFQSVTPAPQPMTPPKNSQDSNATDKSINVTRTGATLHALSTQAACLSRVRESRPHQYSRAAELTI